MIKNNTKDNALIKHNQMKKALRKNGINRTTKEAGIELENFLLEEFKNLAKIVKQRMLIKGKKTLGRQEVIEGITQIRKNKEEHYEI